MLRSLQAISTLARFLRLNYPLRWRRKSSSGRLLLVVWLAIYLVPFSLTRTLLLRCHSRPPQSFFFFNDTATTEIYSLSLHDALPIYAPGHEQYTRNMAGR